MQTLTVIQARMGSTRLPGKALIDIGGQTALDRVIAQVRKCEEDVGKIVVATTTNDEDEAIADSASDHGLCCYLGAAGDVLSRFYHAWAFMCPSATVIVRVTADCLFLDPGYLGGVIRLIKRGIYDYVGMIGAPDGYHAEAFTASTLKDAHEQATDPADREHVVLWMLRNKRCGWINVYGDNREPAELNTPADLERLRAMVAITP